MKRRNRIISLILVIAFAVSIIPQCFTINAKTIDTDSVITVENASCNPGGSVDVAVSIENNPGILSMTLLLEYDETKATLTGIKVGEALDCLTFTKPKSLHSGISLPWDGESIEEEDVKDGNILTLSFDISENAEIDDKVVIKLSYHTGAIRNNDLDNINLEIVNGEIQIIDYTPGDLNDDGYIDTTDVVLLRRYIAGGYGVVINENAADVNDDGYFDTTDVVLIRRFIAGGYGVELKSHSKKHTHNIEHIAAVAATCTEDGNIEYWHCTSCEKCFSDANAMKEITLERTIEKAKHSLIHIEEKAATFDSDGNKEHWKCSVCHKLFLNSSGTLETDEEAIIVPKISRAESTVVYDVYGSDSYLQSVGVINPNKSSFYADEGLVLDDLVAPEGYVFKGWTTASGTPITEIEPGSARKITVNAVWEKIQYTISFYSPIAPRDSVKRTIDEAYPISDLTELKKYKFMGWTDIYGNLVKIVEPGTKDITLYANWISYRNQTISHDYLSKGPIQIEDEENGQYLFVYDIGKIINVPLYTIEDFGNNTSGIIIQKSKSVTNSISSTTAKEITEMIAKSTTNSATWTLSRDWNELVTNTEDFSESSLKENSILISDGWSHTSGSEDNTGTVKDTGTLEKDSTNTKDLTTHNAGGSVEVDVEIAKEGLASKLSPVGVDIKAEGHYDYKHEGGTEDIEGTDTYNLTHTNDLHSSSSSTTNSHNKTTSEKLAEEVSKKWGYSISKSSGGENSTSENSSNTQSSENTYSTTFSYTTAQENTTVEEYSTSSAEPGWHRLVCAGTVHVFAVVGYDIATHSYYFYTYSVLDDKTSEFYDYSATNGEFNDYEVGVLPFECPISVHNIVSDRIYMTNGLIIDDKTGMVVDYEGDYTHINIPDYYSRNNNDGTYDIIKIVGIEPSVFAGNTTIKSVRLSNYITEIPEGLFSGCTSLETVDYNEINSIGSNAFAGCISLKGFQVDSSISTIGENTFSDVSKLTVNASNKNVAQNAVLSGAKEITLNLVSNEDDINNVVLSVGDSTELFTVNGFKKNYNNLEIVSDAKKTVINGITFVNNTGITMKLSSNEVSFDNVNVANASSMIMLLKAENTNITVNGTNTFDTSNSTAVLSKGISVNKLAGSSVKCILQIINGKVYICGNKLTETDNKYFEVPEERIEYIDSEKYNNMLNSHSIYFNANGGIVEEESKTVFLGQKYGSLPIPTRDYYTFEGWYTDPENGKQITSENIFDSANDVTLYAHWTVNSYSTNWENKTGYSVTVQRTSSPIKGARLGELLSGDIVYYGDELTVTYTADKGYDIEETGQTSITVVDNITSEDIYATAVLNSYTYLVKYVSSNGTYLGKTGATYLFGTTNTITASDIAGYVTPPEQVVVWDELDKTITFTYEPKEVSAASASGNIYDGMSYSITVNTRNRKADSVEIQVSVTSTLAAYQYNPYSQQCDFSVAGKNGSVKLCGYGSDWKNYVSNDRSKTETSSWITIPISTTGVTTVSLSYHYWEGNSKGNNMASIDGPEKSGKITVTIPAY